jgi:hypothetical protein
VSKWDDRNAIEEEEEEEEIEKELAKVMVVVVRWNSHSIIEVH